jgi:hypothetical protein
VAKFSDWLAGQSINDPSVNSVRGFADGKPDKWPSSSDDLDDYAKAIGENADPAGRQALLIALGRVYERWQELQLGKRGATGYFGLIGLFICGLVIAAALAYGIFINTSFFDSMANTDHARGLITFLFSFASIGVIILVAIAIFWLDISEVKERFEYAKDLITILVGILGTVLGFYFGTATK